VVIRRVGSGVGSAIPATTKPPREADLADGVSGLWPLAGRHDDLDEVAVLVDGEKQAVTLRQHQNAPSVGGPLW
jgi:hypothetical protein